jgi:peptide/nickel transport system permease protein
VRFVRRQLLHLVPVLFVVTFLSFLLINLLPGDPVITILGPGATQEHVTALRKELALDEPIPVRYVHWLKRIATGHLGQSYVNRQPVLEAIRQRLPTTLELMILAEAFALALAIPMGILAARRPNGIFDRVTTTTAFGLLAVPNFMLAVVLVYVFALHWHLLPAEGYTALTQNPFENLRHLVLPAVTLAAADVAVYVRLLRSEMVTTLQQDFITLARAKGLPDRRILLRHAFRPSTFSLVTVIGLNLGRLIGGAFIVEYIFALPGIGTLTVSSIFNRDYLVVQGTVVLIAVGYVLANFLVDVSYSFLDPRIKDVRALT